jgi:hypothetical protein
LLNDLTRYWRTICVDFEGKHRDTQGNDPKWVSRNAKLRTSRKLLFAGGQAMVEPVFAQTKHNRRINQFQRRGRSAARSEWRLITATHNLMKLHKHHLAAKTA